MLQYKPRSHLDAVEQLLVGRQCRLPALGEAFGGFAAAGQGRVHRLKGVRRTRARNLRTRTSGNM